MIPYKVGIFLKEDLKKVGMWILSANTIGLRERISEKLEMPIERISELLISVARIRLSNWLSKIWDNPA